MTGPVHDKGPLINRLRRVEGQVRGIERMVSEDRDCIDILSQIAAARTALDHVGAKLLEGHVEQCIADAHAAPDGRDAHVKAAEMLDAVQRFLRSR